MDQGHIFQKGYVMAIGVANVIGADSAAGITPPELGRQRNPLLDSSAPLTTLLPVALSAFKIAI